jgi:hypothetical protein
LDAGRGRSFAGSILLSRLAKTHPAINWLQTVGVLERQHPWETRMPTGGGGQEGDEAAKYRPDAKASAPLRPRTTTVLERIAAA